MHSTAAPAKSELLPGLYSKPKNAHSVIYDTCPNTYVRPDNGRMIWDETGRPGYGLYDRALGITYLNGLWEAIDKMSKK